VIGGQDRPAGTARGVACIAVALALVVAGLGIAPSAGAEPPARWDPQVRPIAKQVERLRGLRFEHPVPVRSVSDARFRRLVRRKADDAFRSTTAADRRATDVMLHAFGLLEPERTLTEEVRSNGALFDAYYDPDTHEIVARRKFTGATRRVLLAHELTHVLQDQHFGLGRLSRFDRLEARQAFDALVEGDAMRIAARYARTLSKKDLAAVAAATPEVPDQLPSLGMLAYAGVPYLVGPGVVSALVLAGGRSGVDAAFRDPPDHTIDLLQPSTLPTGVDSAPVPAPGLHRGERRVGRPAPMGAFLMYLALSAQIDPLHALLATDRWRGGTVVAFRKHGRDCARATLRTNVAGSGDLMAAWNAWLPDSRLDGILIEPRTNEVTVSTCAMPERATITDPIEPITALAFRNELLVDELAENEDSRNVACVANGVLADEQWALAFRALIDDDTPDGDARTVLEQRRNQVRLECADPLREISP
jgi:hypothetical protein